MKFGKIDHLLLLGGSRATVELAAALKRGGRYRFDVFTAPRQENDQITADGSTFSAELRKHGIKYRVANDINIDTDFLKSITPNTLAIGIGEAWSFTPEVIAKLEGRLVDLMGIRLPQFRGGAHYTWMILQGNRRGSVNIQIVNEAMKPGLHDSGAIIKRTEYLMPAGARTPADYFAHAERVEVRVILEFLQDVANGKEFVEQSVQETFSLYMPRLNTREQAFIDWQWPTADIEKMICAFDVPYVGASTAVNGALVRLRSVRVEVGDGPFHPYQCGLIYRIDIGHLFVCTRDGTLLVGDVRDAEGRPVMESLRTGDRFTTTCSWLEI
jgi:methionyl-tRNA formyltransferase